MARMKDWSWNDWHLRRSNKSWLTPRTSLRPISPTEIRGNDVHERLGPGTEAVGVVEALYGRFLQLQLSSWLQRLPHAVSKTVWWILVTESETQGGCCQRQTKVCWGVRGGWRRSELTLLASMFGEYDVLVYFMVDFLNLSWFSI